MSIEAASALGAGGYEIERIVVDTHPRTDVHLMLSSPGGSAHVVLRDVVNLRIRQRISNWPFTMQFVDISDRQMEGLAVQVSDGHEDQFRCQCAAVEVDTG
jgi:hypothetical protein